MITKQLIETIYRAANIQRWNDHVRPVGFAELDKQAHKMIIAYVIARFEESAGGKINWVNLIEGGIFEFFHRVKLTDLKPDVFHELMKKKGVQLNNWVIKELEKDIQKIGQNFKSRFEKYLNDKKYAEKEKKVLEAAHYFATNWEFKIIYEMNKTLHGIEKTKDEIENKIKDYYDLEGVKKIVENKRYYGFLDVCGQLGFQQRWAQMRMMPRTSVLGHMMIVAILTYLCLMDKNLSKKRIYNNFYCGLFHDLPEVMTRDIINPVKTSIPGLDDIIREFEKKQIEEKILPLLPSHWHGEINYFVQNEFKNKIMKNGNVSEVKEIEEIHNSDEFSPIDGVFIEACDKFAAFVEACLSINYGIKSKELDYAKEKLFEKYGNKEISGFKFNSLFKHFAETVYKP